MSDIEFGVIDLTCEATDQSFFQPRISLATISQAKVGQIIGFESLDGTLRRYRTATYTGYSEQQLWHNGVMIGAARYEFSGADTLDMFGRTLSNHTKNLSVLCDGDPERKYAELQGNFAVTGASFVIPFLGYWGITGIPQLLGHPTTLCDTPSIPYTQLGDKAVPGNADRSNLWGTDHIQGTSNLGLSKFTIAGPDFGSSVESGENDILVLQYLPLVGSSFTTIGQLPNFWVPGQVKYDNNYQLQLSNEYTEFDALTVAPVLVGDSKTASNSRSLFIITVVNVFWTLNCSNLIKGGVYNVSYDLWNQTQGTTSTFRLSFVSASTTHSISGSTGIPARGDLVTIRNPKISFAT